MNKTQIKAYRQVLVENMIQLGFEENDLWGYECCELEYWIGVYGRQSNGLYL
jgi:hypothetical protein